MSSEGKVWPRWPIRYLVCCMLLYVSVILSALCIFTNTNMVYHSDAEDGDAKKILAACLKFVTHTRVFKRHVFFHGACGGVQLTSSFKVCALTDLPRGKKQCFAFPVPVYLCCPVFVKCMFG